MCEILSQMVCRLEKLVSCPISIFQALDLLEATARGDAEIIVINVMRESYDEILLEAHMRKSA